YEVNDAGFLSRADIVNNGNWFGLNFVTPTKLYRTLYVNFNQWNDWTTNGERLQSGVNVNLNGQFANQWWFWGGVEAFNLGEVYDDRASRGGPSLRKPQRMSSWLG